DRALAVDCGEGSLLRHIDGQGEVGKGMCPIYQNSRKTGWHPVANTQDRRQADGNVAAPDITVECDRLPLASAIVAVSDEVVPGERAAQQLDRGVLQRRRKGGQTHGMRHGGYRSAVWKIGSLLEPTPEG